MFYDQVIERKNDFIGLMSFYGNTRYNVGVPVKVKVSTVCLGTLET